MKRISFFLVVFSLVVFNIKSQVLIAKWTFPTGAASDSICEDGIAANLSKVIKTYGGTSAIDFSKNGATGKAAQATQWNDGNGSKCWQIQISTKGYDSLTISSKQQSGGNNPGPRDYKVQYNLGNNSDWIDIDETVLTLANDWEAGKLENVKLPAECADRDTVLIRWIMNSVFNINGDTVKANGISKIDDIYIYSSTIDNGIKSEKLTKAELLINNDLLKVLSENKYNNIIITDLNGNVIINKIINEQATEINISSLVKGIYFVNLRGLNTSVSRKFIKL
ncbi:MAG: T9SS type A sorting domain-containing protein [Bacteroidales bacterium]|nr:T9SS type A sorting domain-containing protein [Bacteroidales bacterium]